jgi:SPP1 gp7 family putative phage head morphogenesis protein
MNVAGQEMKALNITKSSALPPSSLGTDVPPKEAIAFFARKKLKVGFDYKAVWREEHAKAFTVAGVARTAILQSVKDALQKAITEGRTYQQFKKELTPILQSAGWQAGGAEKPTRLKLIYDTNMRTSRAAGQWQRIQRTKGATPYLLYQLGPSEVHRPEHVKWDGTLLPVDDPWWSTHMPPNGWGCKCHVIPQTSAMAERAGGPTKAPPIEYVKWLNKKTGIAESVPKGIDPGWDYNAGEVTLPPDLVQPQFKPQPIKTQPIENWDKNDPMAPSGKFDKETLLANVEAITKALSEGSIDADAQREVRRQLNALLIDNGLQPGDLVFGKKSRGAINQPAEIWGTWVKGAYYAHNGEILIQKDQWRSMLLYLRGASNQDRGYRTLVHEAVHGSAPVRSELVGAGPGTKLDAVVSLIEEVSTDILAAHIIGTELTIANVDKHLGYKQQIKTVASIIATASDGRISQEQALESIKASAFNMRKIGAKEIQTGYEFIYAFADGLELPGATDEETQAFRNRFAAEVTK